MVFFSKTQAKISPENYGERVKSITVRICITNCTGRLYVTDILLQAGAVATKNVSLNYVLGSTSPGGSGRYGMGRTSLRDKVDARWVISALSALRRS